MPNERSASVRKLILYLSSTRITVIFDDGRDEVFFGPANFREAQAVAEKSAETDAQTLQLVDNKGNSVILVVLKGIKVETIAG